MTTHSLKLNSYRGHLGACHGQCSCNERGDDDDRRQIVADLISMNESPFLPDDEDSLRSMSEGTLHRMRDRYLKKQAKKRKSQANALDLNALVQAELARHSAPARRQLDALSHSLHVRAARDDDADDPALAAMVAPSSLQVYRVAQGQAPGTDPQAEIAARAARNLDAMARGTLPNEGGLNMRDAVEASADDPAVAAMRPRSPAEIVKVYRELGGR